MGGLFSMDGVVYKVSSLIWDLFLLNLLWVVFSIPIVTMGASTTALFYVCGKRVNGNEGYIFSDFLKSFKMNFKQSTIIWLLLIFVLALLGLDYVVVGYMGEKMANLRVIFIILIAEVLIISLYLFPILSKFYIKTMNVVKYAFFMANRHFLTTILCVALMIGLIFVTSKFTFLSMFLISGYAYIASFMFQRIFDKYIPKQEDEDDEWSVQ